MKINPVQHRTLAEIVTGRLAALIIDGQFTEIIPTLFSDQDLDPGRISRIGLSAPECSKT